MSTSGPTPPVIRRMLLCYGIAQIPGCPIYPIGLVGRIQRPSRFPANGTGLWLYFEAMGEPGDYALCIEVVRVDKGGKALSPVCLSFMHTLCLDQGAWFVRQGVELDRVPISGPGVHEVRLKYGESVLARDQFRVEE